MLRDITHETIIALRRGDLELVDILMKGGFVCHEKDKVKPTSKNDVWGEQYIERQLRGT